MTLDRAAALIADTRPVATMTTTIVAIDGLGGAGKSTLAASLSGRFDGTVIHTDGFASWDEPLEWWPRMIDEVLIPFASNRAARFQRFDWSLGALAEWHTVQPGGLVIIEGVSASRAAFRPYLASSIWVETPRDERLRRGLERDGESSAAQWAEWMAEEDKWVAAESPVDYVDLVVSGAARA